jgi:hypothetical protein
LRAFSPLIYSDLCGFFRDDNQNFVNHGQPSQKL